MATADRISALRGMRDVMSAEYARRQRVERTLERHLRLRGYAPVDLPILENTELYLRKSGEEISARLFEFNFKNRRIALRPEITASVLRAYVDHMQDAPLPLRIQYSGPVFRYEKPQQSRYRQFTMAGAELLGASGARADAEVLQLACSGLESVGLSDYKLVIGHATLLEGYLQKLGLRKQLLNHLLRNMENLRKRGLSQVIASLRMLFPEFEHDVEPEAKPDPAAESGSQELIKALREMSDGEARRAISDFLHSLNIRIESNRDEDEVIDRLLHKIREDEQAPKLRLALAYMERLGKLRGSPAEVLPLARALAAEYDLERNPIGHLEQSLACLADYGPLAGQVELDFGLNRGLHYYTGLIFEIHCRPAVGETIQVCGGGRYDSLVSILGGGAPTPAAGFAYGVERVAGLLSSEAAAFAGPDVYVIPITDADVAASLRIAEELRARDAAVEVSIGGRSLRRRLKQADRKSAPLVVIIGESEREGQSVILRDMRSHEEWQVANQELPSRVKERMQADE
ncbi:MAG: ATP phosphoribosyltransferase regulatory subunit [Chloroflexi bacterium]|nr:ATP phosphoribosyltransferase regulatory subunit [Chloroflexota bacterium]